MPSAIRKKNTKIEASAAPSFSFSSAEAEDQMPTTTTTTTAAPTQQDVQSENTNNSKTVEKKSSRVKKPASKKDAVVVEDDTPAAMTVVPSDADADADAVTETPPTFPSFKLPPPPEEPFVPPPPMKLSAAIAAETSKKRGRKPKGGKIVLQNNSGQLAGQELPNIILHLKCFLSDLKAQQKSSILNVSYVPEIETVVSYNTLDDNKGIGIDLNELYQPVGGGGGGGGGVGVVGDGDMSDVNSNLDQAAVATVDCVPLLHDNDVRLIIDGGNANTGPCILSPQLSAMGAASQTIVPNLQHQYQNTHQHQHQHQHQSQQSSDAEQREIWKKIHQLKLTFHKSDMFQTKGTSRSSCFWCTCDFDTPTIYIPSMVVNNSYHVYGCFCSPECAVAFLMNENIDTSTKFERYQLINFLYGKICNYKKSIKPAPNPYYLLNKYYGNLSISEYRKLFKSDQMIYVVNKPLTHILPELYEDNNNFIMNSKVIPTNTLKLKRKYKLGGMGGKNEAMQEAFGFKSTASTNGSSSAIAVA